MKNLTLTLEEEVSILDKYRLTPTELMFIRLLLILQDENEEELFSRYLRILKDTGVKPKDIITSLQEKGIILKSYKIPDSGQQFNPFEIPVNKNFIKNLYKCSFELGKELFEAYPQFGYINNSCVPIRTVAKRFDSLEQAYFKYGKSIGFNPEKHQEIIELVNWAKDNNVLSMSLSSFIINQSWLDLQTLRDGDNVANINYDAVKLL